SKIEELLTAADSWESWTDTAADADALVGETISLLVTRLIRTQGLDGGVFDAAEAFLAELSSRADVPLTVLGQTQELESIDHVRNSVSVRFPGSRIWELSFLGHEFGHHATNHIGHIEPALSEKRPLLDASAAVAQTLSECMPSGHAESHAREFV